MLINVTIAFNITTTADMNICGKLNGTVIKILYCNN